VPAPADLSGQIQNPMPRPNPPTISTVHAISGLDQNTQQAFSAVHSSCLQVDNVLELITKDLDSRAHWNRVKLELSRPGKSTDNAFIESFNDRLRLECLKEHWFLSLEDTREKIES